MLPSTARTRIIGWVLLLVLVALAVVTLVTWRLLVQVTDERMDEALRFEVDEFAELTAPGVNPRTGLPFRTVDEVIGEAIAYNLARPNEKFLGYVDGGYRTQSRQEPGSPEVLSRDPAFAALVATVDGPTIGDLREPGRRRGALPRDPGDPAGRPGPRRDRGRLPRRRRARRREHRCPAHARSSAASPCSAPAAAAWLVAGRILRPLRDVAETARTITDTDLSGRIPDAGEADELGDLVRTVNAMLDRVESGVAAQRRFVDDAGHELRTPITIVRGHLEVLDPADPEDVRATVALVDDELGRMNRMVSDLLLLARSEQPSFLHVERVDVARADRGRRREGRAARRPGVGARDRRRVDALLDPQRITQAVVALADNACRHTGPGDRIGLGSQLAGGRLRFWVSDTGPGVDGGRPRPDLRAVRPRQRGAPALGRRRARPVDRAGHRRRARRSGAARQRARPRGHVHRR